jgi:hypothetical protein
MQYPDMANNNQTTAYHLPPRPHPGPALPHDYSMHAPEPDSTYRLPSVQTLLPISTVYTLGKSYHTPAQQLITCAAPFASPPSLCSPPPHHNTDYGTLPVDLFEPDSSESAPTSPGYARDWAEPDGELGDSLPSSPSSPLVMLTAVPPGWSRRVVVEQGRPAAKYFSPLGKRFSSYDEIAFFFGRQNYSVPRHLFTFGVEEEAGGDTSEESDLADSEQEESEVRSKRRRLAALWEAEEMVEMVTRPLWSPPPTASPTIA